MANTWLTPEKKKDLLSYIEQGANEEDLYAAGYTNDDLFEVGYFNQPSVEPFVPRPEDTLQEYNPTKREDYRVGIQEKLKGFGVDEALSADIAEGVTGNTSPTDGSLGIGLMDFSPFGAAFGIEEGSRTAKRGWENSDPLTTGLGVAEAGLSLLEAAPGVGAIAKGVRKTADAMVDAYDPTVMNALLGRGVPMYKDKVGPSSDTIEFQSPIPEALDAVYDNVFRGKLGKTIKGSQLIKEIQDNSSIRKSEWDSLDIEIDKTKDYSGPELLQMAETARNKWRVKADIGNDRFRQYQRQDVIDPELDYYEVRINADAQGGKTFKARSQHFENETLSHTRASLREDVNTKEKYFLVEELQSDLLQQGYIKPDKNAKFEPRAFSDFFRTHRAQFYDNLSKYTEKDPEDLDKALWEFSQSSENVDKLARGLPNSILTGRGQTQQITDFVTALREHYNIIQKEFYPLAGDVSDSQLISAQRAYGTEGVTSLASTNHNYNLHKDSPNPNVDEDGESFLNLSAADFAETIDFELGTVASNYKRFQKQYEQNQTSALPPIRKTEEGVRLSIQALMGKADQEGVDKIVIPPFEKIVEKRFAKGSAEYQNALEEKSGFYATYIKSLNKVLGELEKEFGDGVKISQRPLDYGKTAKSKLTNGDIDYFAWGLFNYRNAVRNGTPVRERDLERINRIASHFDELGVDYGNIYAEDIGDFENLLIERYNEALDRTPIKEVGIEIDISGIRQKYDLTKPRFAQGGMVESNMIDPVSKNPVPPGATPKEVRDDIDIKASEGEYVIPADVVRFLGLDKIEKMIGAAKKGMMEMQQNGRIGGSKPGDDDLPFHPSELQAMEDAGQAPQAPARMAVGGVVTSPTQAPQRFNPYNTRQATPEQPPNYIPPVPGQDRYTEDDRRQMEESQNYTTRMSRNPNEWEADDFGKFAENRGSGPNRLIEQGIKSLVPMGSLALENRYRYLDTAVPKQINDILKTGVDGRGNKITDQQRTRLTEALKQLETEKRPESGFGRASGGLMGGLFDMALDRFAPKKEEPAKEKPAAEKEGSSSTNSASDRDEASRSPSTSQESKSAADRHDTGNTGRDSNYRKGGLITRR